MDDALKLAIEEYQTAAQWSETCRENVRRLERELIAAQTRSMKASDKLYLANQNLLQVSSVVKL